ncbi:MAG: DUF4118 domain-containing protein, partial [Pirellulales bacterium]
MLARLKPLPRYLLMILAVGASILLALAVRALIQPTFPGQVSGPILFVGVAFSAWYGGAGPGLLAAVLSSLSLEFLFLPPVGQLELTWHDAPRLLTVFGAAIALASLTARRQRAEAALGQAHESELAAQQIQKRIFPSSPPDSRHFDIAGASYP